MIDGLAYLAIDGVIDGEPQKVCFKFRKNGFLKIDRNLSFTASRSGVPSIMFYTHIAGIFYEYVALAKIATAGDDVHLAVGR